MPYRSSFALCRRAALTAVAVLLLPAVSFALGLGEIRIKSAYNRGFAAEIPVFLEANESDLKAGPGTQADYNMLQIGRPPFIDSLTVTIENTGSGSVIAIRSKEPITQPSFNLIIRATAGGGAVLENYFLAVDFRKTLSLDLPPPEETAANTPPPPPAPEERTETAAALPPAPPATVAVPLPVPAIQTAAAKPAPHEQTAPPKPLEQPKPEPQPEPAALPMAAVEQPKKTPEPAPAAPVQQAELPAPVPVVAVKDEGPAAPAEPEAAEDTAKTPAPDSGTPEGSYKVKRGDTLFGVARALKPAAGDIPRLVAAIYLENREAFINDDVNLLRAGAKLNTASADKRAETLSDADARRILYTGYKGDDAAEGEAPMAAAPLPGVPVPTEKVTAFLEEWRTAWMQNSPAMDDLYSESFRGWRGRFSRAKKEEWLASRRQFNDTHQNRTVTISGVKMSRDGDAVAVTFTQRFESDQLTSTGEKRLTLIEENGALKITEERVKVAAAKDRTHQWVIVLPAVQSRTLATAHVNRLRGQGFAAFEAGGRTENPQYVPAVGRMASREEAVAVLHKLRAAGEQEAKVVRFPFSIKLATAENPASAAETLKKLAGNGYSAFLVDSGDAGHRLAVCVGAFASREEAEEARASVAADGFTPVTTVP